MANETVRSYASKKRVKLWEIADKLNMTDCAFSRKLRKEFSEEEKKNVFDIIDDIANGGDK